MMHNSKFTNSRQSKKWRLFLISVFVFTSLVPVNSFAHQSPNTLIFLDVSPGSVAMEIQLPVPELELAFGNNISKNPETLIERLGPQLTEYIKAHINAYVKKDSLWTVKVTSLKMDKGKYIETGLPYWEVIARIVLTPQPGEDTRKFMLDYDVIMHQVANHVALVSIRSDWESGKFADSTTEAAVISWNFKDNVIDPLEINLGQGSKWKGFKSMFALGMAHIKEGTDHLLFLMVLLLPAMLLVNGKKWGGFGGTMYSLKRLLKIVTAFTIGHSVTLLAGAAGWLTLPQQPVEILIAVSILVSAIHALRPVFPGKEIYVAAGFGLIHGLAFAAILSKLSLTAGTLALSILGFNLGIELMQVCIIIIIIPWLILLCKTPYYKWLRTAGAVLAAIAAVAWIAERTTGKSNTITLFITKMSAYDIWLVVALAAVSLLLYFITSYKKNKKTV